MQQASNPVTILKLKLLADYLAVAPLAVPLKSAGGTMFMPENVSARERSQRGVVLAVGPGDWRDDGAARVPVDAAVGDLVFFGKYSGTEEELGGRTVLVMRETECRMRVSAGAFTVVEHEDVKLNHLEEDYCELCQGPEDKEAADRLAAMRAEFVGKQADAGALEPERPRRPCAGADGQPCDMMQTLYPNGWGARARGLTMGDTPAGDAVEEPGWVGEVCGHRHPFHPGDVLL